MKFTLLFAFLLLPFLSIAQTTDKVNPYFPGMGPMPVGGYYYPEHWHHSRWEPDLKKMAELGFKFVHIGEFAWARMEPTEGNYNFGWLDTCVNLAAKYKLKVILCTPSPCPPAWLSRKYPEILAYNVDGRQVDHGARQQGSWSSEKYRDFVEKITDQLGKRYGKNPHVIGWQLDNEPSHYDVHFDYGPAAEARFRVWLKEKYGTVDKLNTDWGTAFWSQTYNNFEQIRIPNSKVLPAGANAHALLDFQRFNNAELTRFLALQTNTLRKSTNKSQFITTNYAYYKFLPEIDLWDKKDILDFASYTFYPLSTYLDKPKGDLAFRLGSGIGMSFASEFAQSINGYSGIMELQPGQINWGAYNAQPLPGAVRMWIFHNYALGAGFVCNYRFDRPIYGNELYHYGIMSPDPTKVDRGGLEYVQAVKELETLSKSYNANAKAPKEYAARQVSILWNNDNVMDIINHKENVKWDTYEHVYKYYSAAKQCGSAVKFLDEKVDFNPAQHPIMIAPAYQLADQKLVDRWTKYAEQGGHLVLSVRTGQKDRRGHLYPTQVQQLIFPLIGAEIEFFDNLPPNQPGKVNMGGKTYAWDVWGEIMNPKSSQAWATFDDQFYKGKAAVVHRKLGKGSVTFVGVDSEEGLVEKATLDKLMDTYKIARENHAPYFFKHWRGGQWVCVNYTSENQTVDLPKGAKVLLGDKVVPPGGVLVFTE